MKPNLGWISIFVLANSLTAGEPNYVISAEEHSRRIACMKQIAESSGGKIEIEILPETPVLSFKEAMCTRVKPELSATAAPQIPADIAPAASLACPAMVEQRADESTGDKLYTRALRLFYDKKYQQALELLQKLLATFPTHDRQGVWSYWCGECSMALDDEVRADEYWQAALTTRDRSKADLALLRLVQLNHHLGRRAQVRSLLNTLLIQFPQSDGAIIARTWYDKI